MLPAGLWNTGSHRAVQAGWKDADHMKNDKDLDALRENPDFKALLESLARGKTPEKK